MAELAHVIERWKAGDERAAEIIYNQVRGTTFGLAQTLLGDPADAEEVAQDALTYALTHIDRYNPPRARFETWLHTIWQNPSGPIFHSRPQSPPNRRERRIQESD